MHYHIRYPTDKEDLVTNRGEVAYANYLVFEKLKITLIVCTCFVYWKKWALEEVLSTGFVFLQYCTLTGRRSLYIKRLSHRPKHHNVV